MTLYFIIIILKNITLISNITKMRYWVNKCRWRLRYLKPIKICICNYLYL